jgi:hypothetical protein
VLITDIDSAGYFERWERLPVPPSDVSRLEINESRALVAVLESGERAILPFRAAEWQASEGLSANIATPCDPSLSALTQTTRPPAGLKACIQHLERGADCDLLLVYAMDSGNNVWEWNASACALRGLGVALVSFVATFIVYLLISLSLAVIWLRKRERAGR